MPRLITAFVLAATCPFVDAGLSFITLGDWGGAALEEPSMPYSQNVKDVASQMEKTATEKDVKFVINTGDNFYWCGLQNTSDFQIEKDWLEPYKASALQVPWYGILGNHEYGYNVDVQIELSKQHPNWVMDARYFTRRLQLQGSIYVSLILLDTSPCVSEYRSDSQTGWDPCGTEYPTCSLSGGHDDFEGTCKFHENILTQNCSTQYEWFKQTLSNVPKDDWLIIVGHHPGDELDVEDLTSAMQARGFDLYLNGHAHCLTHYTVDGKGAYVTSGAGSLVMSKDQLGGTRATDRTYNKVHNTQVEAMADASLSSSGHSYEATFSVKKSGFTLHTFSDDFNTLTTEFLDTSGTVLHSFVVSKRQPSPPGPSPSPPAPPAPPAPGPPTPGTCCLYDAGSCMIGQTCCNSSGKSYASEDVCTQYGAAHHCIWDGSTCKVGTETFAI